MAYSLKYTYNSTSNSYSVTGWSDITTSDKVVIPSTYDDGTNGSHPVTSIGNRAFSGCRSLTSITIPNSVTSIGSSAFNNCSSLTSITIPNSVTSIGDWAFNNCSSLTSITIPNSVTSIGERAFNGCRSLTSITIPNSVTSIGNRAFSGCSSLTSVTIPDSVTSIATYAFAGCDSLTSVTIPDSVTSIGSSAFYSCSSLTSVTIPDSVTSIGSSAFCGCSSLTSVTIPDSVTSIGDSVFDGCSSLTSVTIGNSVTSIGEDAFNNCSKLKQLILFPSTPPTLASNAIPNNVQSIYVPQSSKAAYQAAANWAAFVSKIVSDNIYLSFVRFNQKNKEYIDGKIGVLSIATNLENGTGAGSLVQKRLKSDGVTWTTAKAYQGAGAAFGGGTQAGRTEEEFNAYFWDSTKNVALNGGKGKDSNGNILDNNGLNYAKSYSYALAEGESTKALGRSSHAEGNATQSIGDNSHSEGLSTKAEGYAAHTEGAYTEAYYTGSHAEGNHTKTYAPYQHVGGTYNHYNINALYQVGNGTSDNDRKNAFEVLKDGRAKVQTAPVDADDVVRKGDLTASTSSSTGLAASFKSLKSYKVPSAANDVLRFQEFSALVGSGIQGTGNPPLQGYNKDKGTIEERLTNLGFKSLPTSTTKSIRVSGAYAGGDIGSIEIQGDGNTTREGNRVTLQLRITLTPYTSNRAKDSQYYAFYFDSEEATVTGLIPAEYRPKEDYTFITYRRVYLEYKESPLPSVFANATYMIPITCTITTNGDLSMKVLTRLNAEFSGHDTMNVNEYTCRNIVEDSRESDVTISRTIKLGYSAEPL